MVLIGSEKPPMVIIELEAAQSLARRIGVHRAHRSVVAGIHRLQKIKGFGSANLADDDALRPHAQAVAHQVAHCHGAGAFEIRRACLEPHDMRLLQLEFGRVLAGDDAFGRIDIIGSGN